MIARPTIMMQRAAAALSLMMVGALAVSGHADRHAAGSHVANTAKTPQQFVLASSHAGYADSRPGQDSERPYY